MRIDPTGEIRDKLKMDFKIWLDDMVRRHPKVDLLPRDWAEFRDALEAAYIAGRFDELMKEAQ